MPNKAVAASYSSLLVQIKNTIESGRKTIELTKALTYWKIGKYISSHLLKSNGQSEYGEKLFHRLSHDLNVDVRTLQQSVKFSRELPIPSARSRLDWSHYRSLITIDDPLLRDRLLKKAWRDKLTTRELAQEIQHATYDAPKTKPASKLIPKRGQLYIYKLINVDGILEVDCGFHITRALDLTGLASPKEGSLVISEKSRIGFTFSPFKGTRGDLYTYKAGSIRVVDGDTLSCRIDCGFRTKIKRSLRLRGINAPEIKTVAGQASKRFAQRRLKGKSVIIFRSYGIDNHGRYLADVFYKSADGKEIYLNQELLDSGFAKWYQV